MLLECPVCSGSNRIVEEEGTVVLFGRTRNADASGFGLVIFEAESEQAADRIMCRDPAVRHNLMRATLFPYRIAGKRSS